MPRIIDAAKRDRNAISIYGCPEVDALALNEGRPLREPGGLALAYTTQRLAARRRGIGWELTFEQWLRLWRASGRLADRGVGAGRYCMARDGDRGPYSVSNVSIQLSTVNSRDGLRQRTQLPNVVAQLRTGTGRGWTFRRGSYQVMVAHRYVGSFKTREEAETAYRAAASRLMAEAE